MVSANLKIIRGEVSQTRSDLTKNNPIAYNGHKCLFTTIPEQIENNISINFSTLGTIQSQIDFWKGQKREVEVSCP